MEIFLKQNDECNLCRECQSVRMCVMIISLFSIWYDCGECVYVCVTIIRVLLFHKS